MNRMENDDSSSSSSSSSSTSSSCSAEKPLIDTTGKNFVAKFSGSKRKRIDSKNPIPSPLFDNMDDVFDDPKDDKKCVRNLMDSFDGLNVSTTVNDYMIEPIFDGCQNAPKHIQQIKELLFPIAECEPGKQTSRVEEATKKNLTNLVVTFFDAHKDYFQGFPKNDKNPHTSSNNNKKTKEKNKNGGCPRNTRSMNADVQFLTQIEMDRPTRKPEESSFAPTRLTRASNHFLLDPKSALIIHKNSFWHDPKHPAMYGLEFNPFCHPDNIFATCGASIVMAFACTTDSSNDGMKPLFAHVNPNDQFYTCCWSYDIHRPKHYYLITAGKMGVIRIIDVLLQKEVKTFQGHCGAVNHLKISLSDPSLLLSASKDSGIRLWNLTTNVCVAIFGGVQGHRDEVLSLDFHREKSIFVSTSIDHSIKIWSLKSPEVAKAIEDSREFRCDAAQHQFPTVSQHYPNFSTRHIHHNYVDCVQWFGDLLITKSCQEELVIWKPGTETETLDDLMRRTHHSDTDSGTPNLVIIKQFKLIKNNVWFVKFSFDLNELILAVGNLNGHLYIYDLKHYDPHQYRMAFDILIPTAEKLNPNVIRQTAFNHDGTILIVLAESSYIIRYDLARLYKTQIHTYLRLLQSGAPNK